MTDHQMLLAIMAAVQALTVEVKALRELVQPAQPSSNCMRQRRWRERRKAVTRNADVTPESVTCNAGPSEESVTRNAPVTAEGGSPDKRPPAPPKNLTPPPVLPSTDPPTGALSHGFTAFWARYPNKVAKRAAQLAYERALRRADEATILAGLEAANARQWSESLGSVPHPSTWLNGDRWGDEPAGDLFPRPMPLPTGGMVAAAAEELGFRRAMEKLSNGHDERDRERDPGALRALSAPPAFLGRV